MNYCGKCGCKIESNDTLCQNCGNTIAVINTDEFIVSPKKSKNKLVGVIACGIALIIHLVGIVTVIAIITTDNYEDVAQKYVGALYTANYDGLKECLPYDVDEMFYDLLRIQCQEEDMTMEEVYEDIGKEYKTEFDSSKKLLPQFCGVLANEAYDELGEWSMEIQIADSRKLEDYEINSTIQDSDYPIYGSNIDLSSYIDKDKIKSGYEVKLTITALIREEVYQKDVTYTIVQYGRTWKVLTNFCSEEIGPFELLYNGNSGVFRNPNDDILDALEELEEL